jgi:hypothetical protein
LAKFSLALTINEVKAIVEVVQTITNP